MKLEAAQIHFLSDVSLPLLLLLLKIRIIQRFLV